MKYIFMIMILLAILPLTTALSLTYNSPENKIYNTNSVLFNLTANEKSYFYYSNIYDSGNWIKLCPTKNLVCEKIVRAREGVNNFQVKAVSDDGTNITIVSFKIDSKKPRIIKTFPGRNSIINGSLFYIQYSEDNLTEIMLYYGEDKLNKTNCESGINKQCNFSVNLSAYNDKEIEYWFEVFDKVNNVVSTKTKIKVDTTKPVTTSTYLLNGNKMKFVFDVIEENFKGISYEDNTACLPEHKASGLLCSNLQNGRCVVTKNFCEGNHNLTIIIRDKAGNTETLQKGFTVDLD